MPRVTVDTGSDATRIAAPILRRAGIRVRRKDQTFVMANGQTVCRDIGYAIIRFLRCTRLRSDDDGLVCR